MLQTVAYERGLHIRGTPLWFDAERRQELCVLTGFERRMPPVHRRVIASAPMALALEAAGYAGGILPSPWRRPLGLGGQRVHLIDAEAPLGAAAALLEMEDEQLLVMGLLRANEVPWPHAEHVVTRLPAWEHAGQPLGAVAVTVAAEAARLLQAKARPIICVDSIEVGVALLAELTSFGQQVSPRGILAKFVPAALMPSRGITMVVGGGRQTLCEATLRVDSGLNFWGPTNLAPKPLALRWYADVAALRAVVASTKARRVTVVDAPPGAAEALHQSMGRGVKVRCLHDAHQLLLAQPLI